MFSQAEVPLIVDAVPMLEVIELSLAAVKEDPDKELPNVTHVAGQAALLLLNKYSVFTAECEVYQIAIGMCFKHLELLF
jgi:hypothetical protein